MTSTCRPNHEYVSAPDARFEEETLPSVRPHPRATEILVLGLVFAEVMLVGLLLQTLDLQTSALRRVIYVAAVGFLVHHLLPARLRLPFFVALGIGALFLILGGPDTYLRTWDADHGLLRGGAVLVMGLCLIGLCRMPISFPARLGLVLAVGGATAAFRGGFIPVPRLAVVWPVLAALFMFRLAIYLYDLSIAKARPPLTPALAYFFLPPNAACLLFPVIDYSTFSKSVYTEPALAIYQRGARWMARGAVQLIVYRFVDQLFALTAADVAGGADLIQFILTNMLRYLKISGVFHLVVGLLLLFGFNLPAPNQRYFLASSFTDYWRRVNIYWKDFLVKVVYYPTFFRLKRFGATPALVVATLWCFVVTWALHLYQTWWVTGAARPTWPDAVFWLALGLLVAANALWEMKHTRPRRLAGAPMGGRAAAGLVLRTAGTFICISLLWSLWTSPSLSFWVGLWRYADRHTLLGGTAAVGAIMLGTVGFEVWPRRARRRRTPSPAASALRTAILDLFRCALPLFLLYLGLRYGAHARLADARLQPFQDALRAGDSLVGEFIPKGRGYYEQLTNVDEGNLQLWETLLRIHIDRPYSGPNPIRPVQDFRLREPLPSVHVQAYDTDFQTNRWGMRDRDYELAKPAGTMRLALLGSSHVMGWGVQEQDVFATLLAARLNRAAAANRHFEVLNFGFNGLSPLGQIAVLQRRVRPFAPDLVIFVGHSIDPDWVTRDLPRAVRQKIPITDAYLQGVMREARIGPRTPQPLAVERLKPFEGELIKWSYGQILGECRRLGALPVYVFLPTPGESGSGREPVLGAGLVELARRLGFVVLDFADVFEGQRPEALLTRDVYPHINARAHALVADALYQALVANPRFHLGLAASAASLASTASNAGGMAKGTRAGSR